jgi:aminoglycoside phosphotransferase (APT) family kinase protein
MNNDTTLPQEPAGLPPMPEGLTPAWLTQALTEAGLLRDGARVVTVRQAQVGEGAGMMSELARLHLDYAGAGGAQLPATLVAKFPSRNANNREVAMAYRLYEREVRYFAELAPRSSAPSPRTWYSRLQGSNFVILMEDMDDYRVGDQVVGADLRESELMTDALAHLHASFWNGVDDLDWVPRIAGSYHAQNMQALVGAGWQNMARTFEGHLDASIAARGDAFAAALPALQAIVDTAPVTLLHGDFRMENVFFGTRPEHHPTVIIDWQGPLRGRGVVDLGLMLGQSTQHAVRVAHERELVRRYAERLAAHGVRDYGADRAWQHYLQAQLYNWA